MTINEWAKDFRSFVNELQMSRDDYKGIMEYIDDAIALLKQQAGLMLALEQSNSSNEYLNAEVERLAGLLKKQEAVVRCKDCENQECEGHNGYIVCGITGESHPPTWFCADGERKEGR